MPTLSQFSSKLKKASKGLQKKVDAIVSDLTGNIHAELVDSTPVLTGQAQTNWRVYLDGNSALWLPKPLGPESGAIEAKSSAKSLLSANKKTYHIINPSPYIIQLNNGYSKKAPAYFVESSVYAAINMTTFDLDVMRD